MENSIKIKGARVNNLKNIDLEIPREKLVVITGLSGSGKSSLAFDTLYAEGQRRYVESLSAYARQFLGRMHKPEVDFIKGLPPAIAIEQKVTSRNPRSTVGTSTEIYDYLRLLFARIGHTFSPISGKEVRRHSVDDIIDAVHKHVPGTRFTVLTSINLPEGRSLTEQLQIYMQQGFSRLEVLDEAGQPMMVRIEDILPTADQLDAEKVYLLVSRNVVDESKEGRQQLNDAIETALFEGRGECSLRFYPEGTIETFSIHFEMDGIQFEEPTDQLFSFNSPFGACPECEGFGRIMGIDESLVIPNSALSVHEGAVMCWRGDKMSEWLRYFERCAAKIEFPIFEPYYSLTQEQKDLLWHATRPDGSHEPALLTEYGDYVCIDSFFDMLRQNQYKIQYRVMLARYRGKTTCPKCHGSRLRREALYVQIGGKTIAQLGDMSIEELCEWFDNLQLEAHEQKVATRLLTEIRSRLSFLKNVGLSYLTLSRLSNSLSGGESQRINLATSLGSSLVGSLYILDEPSIGLHSRDTQQLIGVLKQLRDLGNTVIVVEHDEEIIRQADYIIDIGPDAGRLGGEVVWAGHPTKGDKPQSDALHSHTYNFLVGADRMAIPSSRRPWNNSITVRGARANNLKGINVQFPLNVLTCITGVSGSGKSTLVRDILYRAVKRQFDEACDRPGEFEALEGSVHALQAIEFVDQNPIGKSSRSNPVTYIKAFDEIRRLMAEQALAIQMDYTPSTFSFNAEGGRCEECKGEGSVKVEMQFMADLVLECEACHGQRFKHDVLEVRFEGKNIHDILEMTVNQAVEFFSEHKQKRIVDRLLPLQRVGLGYIKLGQSSSTLSGGENQRVKLAYYLGLEGRNDKKTLFIFDEPTTGLHYHDIQRLIEAFNGLLQRGHSIICIEHNLDVIAQADHIIDLGPEGGAEGGYIVATGTPEEVVKQGKGYTARYLRDKLN